MPRSDLWTDDELHAAVEAYLAVMATPDGPATFSPTALHRSLIAGPLHRRNESAVGRRMSNISTILKNEGEKFIERYPASLPHYGEGVGTKVLAILKKIREQAREPVDDSTEAALRAQTLLSQGRVPYPNGNHSPRTTIGKRTGYARSPAVVAWVLQEAKGVCEGCNQPAPFLTAAGAPYLEVHHVLRLVDGGPDTVDNALALCPNCHRRLHHSADASAFSRALIKRINRLVQY